MTEERIQTVEKQDEFEWEDVQKSEVISYIRALGDKMRDYFSYAIQYANEQEHEAPEEFWRKLFCERKTPKQDPIQREKGSKMDRERVRRGEITPEEAKVFVPDVCPANPYQELDIQALCKYLRYGDDRKFPEGEEDDSKNFYKFFQFKKDENDEVPLNDLRDFKSKKPNLDRIDRLCRYKSSKKVYITQLDHAIKLRNEDMAHVSGGAQARTTWDTLDYAVSIYEYLTAQMQRRKGWMPENLTSLKDFWKNIRTEIKTKFGTAPLELKKLGQELFLTEGEELSSQQWGYLEEICRDLSLDCRNGMIYHWKSGRNKLLAAMQMIYRNMYENGTVTEETAAAVLEEQDRKAQELEEKMRQTEERENHITAPLWSPIPQKAARALRQGGPLLHMTEKVWQTLLDGFQVLVDESIFLSPEGREVLMGLQNALAVRHAKLTVDASVVSAIFHQFRTSAPYTALELADMEAESREEMQKLRQKVHQETKTAIKVLRHLREHSCLEVAASPTDSRSSYENIAWLARIYPEARFLVLTLDRQLAEELSQLKSRNAVTAKPDLEGNLLFFRSTRAIYTDMLRPVQEAALLVHQKPGAGTEVSVPAQPQTEPNVAPTSGAAGGKQDTILHVRRIPKVGEMVAAEYGDGATENLRLGKFLNSGGEGSIYLTSRNDLVAKIYLEKHLTQGRLEKLRHMVAANPKINGLCWPCALLYNSFGEWIGFLMPKAEGKELATTVFTPGRGCCNIKNMGWSRRHLVSIAANIADLFSDMHRSGILMGDVNPRNFMVRPDCTVYFVDCDSYQFDGFSCPVFSPLFLPPEVHQRMRGTPQSGSSSFTRTQENELYSIAVLLFEVLFLGKAPYESRNGNNDDVIQAIIDGDFPYPFRGEEEDENVTRRSAMMAPVGRWRYIWSNLPYGVKEAFYDVFSKEDKARPSASAWARTMRN